MRKLLGAILIGMCFGLPMVMIGTNEAIGADPFCENRPSGACSGGVYNDVLLVCKKVPVNEYQAECRCR